MTQNKVKVQLKEGVAPVEMTVPDLARWILQHAEQPVSKHSVFDLAAFILEQEKELIKAGQRALPVFNAK